MSYRKLFQVKPGGKLKSSQIDPAFTEKQKNKTAATADLEKLRRSCENCSIGCTPSANGRC